MWKFGGKTGQNKVFIKKLQYENEELKGTIVELKS
jgi:hypothetical protein